MQGSVFELVVADCAASACAFLLSSHLAAGFGERPVADVFICGSLDPEPCVECGTGSIAGQGCYLCEDSLLAALGANARRGPEPCHVSQGQTAVGSDIKGLELCSLVLASQSPVRTGLEGSVWDPVFSWKAWFECHL